METSTLEALKRISAIEAEAKELRKIVENESRVKAKKLVYDADNLYVGVRGGDPPMLMAGSEGSKYFRFHKFHGDDKTCAGCYSSRPTGQECLDTHIAAGFEIHVFDDTREAFQFFLDQLSSLS